MLMPQYISESIPINYNDASWGWSWVLEIETLVGNVDDATGSKFHKYSQFFLHYLVLTTNKNVYFSYCL